MTKLTLSLGMHVIDDISPYDVDPWNGRLLVWEPPEPGELYAMGVDPAEGVGADNSVCSVLKIGTKEHPDVQVAEFASNFLDPIEFAEVVAMIGHLYAESDGTDAFCTIECNATCGDVIVNDLRSRLDYSNLFVWKIYDKRQNIVSNKLGWWTNRSTRPKLIARGLHALLYGDLVLNSAYLLDEMADFQQDHYMAKAAARSGRHDDRIMALLIAYWGAHDDEWLNGEDVAAERRARQAAPPTAVVAPAVAPKPDYQSRAISYRDMMQEAEDALFGE